MFASETTQGRVGAPGIAVDESRHDLVDEESVGPVNEEIQLPAVEGLVCRWWRGQGSGGRLSAQESKSSHILPSRIAARRNRMPWLSPGFSQSRRSKTLAAASARPSLQRQRP